MSRIISRRGFVRTAAMAATGTLIIPSTMKASGLATASYPLRLGGPVPGKFTDPSEWVKAVRGLGYSAAFCPLQPGVPSEMINAFRYEAMKSSIIIAEVGVWNNMLDPDEKNRILAVRKNAEALQLADEIGAKCCVNISGARGEIWDGPYPGNYTPETFDLIVETVRSIIDQVKPANAFYTLEPMPYMLPDSPDSYLKLIKAIGRKQFAVHLDPVNMISSPERYFNNGAFIKECFSKLGPYIKSIHAKDILIKPELTLHLEERRPGLGYLDYRVFLTEAVKLKDIPFMLEHLSSQEDYRLAADYVRKIAGETGIRL